MNETIKNLIKKNAFLYQCALYLNNLPIIGALNQFYQREFYIFPQKKLAYLKMHKVACTSIQKSLLKIHQENASINFVRETDIHSEVNWNVCNKLKDQYYCFTFVRNPFDRLVSCYKNQFHEYKKNREVFLYKYYLGGIFNEQDSFGEFVEKVCRVSDHRADGHFKSQYSLIYNFWGKCLVHYVGKFENMSDDFAVIERKYGLDPLPHFNKTKLSNYMNYYTLELAHKVYKRYQKDVNCFGYQKEYQELLQKCRACPLDAP